MFDLYDVRSVGLEISSIALTSDNKLDEMLDTNLNG